jgi:hypothetical protein
MKTDPLSVHTAPRGNSPAFPCQDNQKQIWTGMNLRDYFALEAMNSFVRNDKDFELDITEIAAMSYEIANAMLDEREKFR